MTRLPRSASVPISRVLRIDPGVLCDPIRDAVRVIDSVHRDGNLPTIQVYRDSHQDRTGAYHDHKDPPEISVSRFTTNDAPDLIEMIFLHEVGHFLDHQAFGAAGTYASETHPVMEDWREAVRQSEAIQTLESRRTEDRFTVYYPDGRMQDIPIRLDYVDYLLGGRELFARSYAQYIAYVSRNATLMEQLNFYRRQPIAQVYPRQWEDIDFEPILQAIQRLLNAQGWRR